MKHYLIILVACIIPALYSNQVFATEMHFIKYEHNPISITNPENSQTVQYAFHPFVIYENQRWKLWYSTKTNGRNTIGYAISPDGIHWSQQANIDFPEFQGINNPSILKKDGMYYLFFSGEKPENPMSCNRR